MQIDHLSSSRSGARHNLSGGREMTRLALLSSYSVLLLNLEEPIVMG